MRNQWTKNMATAVISTSLFLSAAPYHAAAEAAASLSATASYNLTDTIQAEVKSILNEQTSDGTRIGAVVRLYNEGNKTAVIPEYEVRVKTDNGIEYTLRPSSTNVKSILPKEQVELSYMAVVDREDPFNLSMLSWVNVNKYVYPQLETTKLAIPIPSMEWKGEDAVITDPSALKNWGESFTLPVLSTSLEYKPVSVFQDASQGSTTIVTFLVENKGVVKESISEFEIDGKSAETVYNGKRVEKDSIELEPGDKQYIHYAIPTKSNDQLKSVNVLTPESFSGDNGKEITYSIGRLNIHLPQAVTPSRLMSQLPAYIMNKTIRFDPMNKLIQPDIDVSMAGLQMFAGEGDGYNTVVAKFRLQNHSDQPIQIPNFLAELTSVDGYSYLGTRQNLGIQSLIPNLSYIIYYTFIIPSSEQGEKLGMSILDGDNYAPYNIPIAAFRTQIQDDTDDSEINFYPYKVKLNNWKVGTNFEVSTFSYTYKLLLDMAISQDKAVVDQNFSRMDVEVTNKDGKVLGSQSYNFTGKDRLIRGDRTISFSSEEFEYPLTVKFYETVDTVFGEARRLVKTLQQ